MYGCVRSARRRDAREADVSGGRDFERSAGLVGFGVTGSTADLELCADVFEREVLRDFLGGE